MDVGELLSFQPDKPGTKRRKEEEENERPSKTKRRDRINVPVRESHDVRDEVPIAEVKRTEEILQMVEDDGEDETLDDTALKKMILAFEKKVLRNQEMRIKYPENPERFMESEVDLNDILQEMHVIATVPDLYHILVELNAVQSLLQLLSHDNTDISIAVVDLLQELTDVDALTESDDAADILIDSLLDGQVVALLVQNLERLDETVKEEADGVYNTLGIIENLTELKPEVCTDAASQGMMTWLLKRLKAKMPFDANKLYASEVLAILLQNHSENRILLGDVDGIDILLQQLASYKKHDPSSAEEIECMENLFNCLCSALMLPANRERFLKGEGLQLMNLMLREKKMSRNSAIKVLDHAMTGPEGADNCQKFVDILGLRSIFPVFMKTPKTVKKGTRSEELEEHIVSVIANMLRNCQSTQRQRLMNKFMENDHEKVDRLMELHFKYLERVRHCDQAIEREKGDLKYFGGDINEEDQADQFYLRRLDAGLFTLQLIDYIMLETCTSGPSSIKHRMMQILNMRGGSIKTIRSIMREYAANIGDATDLEQREADQNRILSLVDKF
ncbi:beta-catenin-like protein 1 [Lineus longissimus]|uniref:beta-catenin-like protein 1 n=1 Tax=Lineus longissimus TaxID=88925 RepID=UPI002B4F4C32